MNFRQSASTALFSVAALIGTLSGFPAMAESVDYTLLTAIPIPATSANNQGGKLTGFDIGFVDPVTGYYYLADRSNASVDVINGATNQVISQIGGFVGQQATTSTSGPDGVLVVNNGGIATLYAGDGGSTLRSFNVTNPAAPIAGGTVNTGGGVLRVDEMAYSPFTNTIFAANNANSPAFASIISANPLAPTLVRGNITIPGQVASGGMEQSIWNPNTGTFFVSVPTFNGNDSGGVQEFSTTGTALRAYNFSSMGLGACSPTGLSLGASGNLMVGCGTSHTQTVVLNPVGTGTIVANLTQVSGSDELYYDPVTKRFYVTGVNAAGHRVIDVFDDNTYTLLQQIDLTALGAGTENYHSVAVDPLNGDIFVPLSDALGSDILCPNGCVAVFAEQDLTSTPLPAALPMFAGGLGLVGFLARRKKRKAETAPAGCT